VFLIADLRCAKKGGIDMRKSVMSGLFISSACAVLLLCGLQTEAFARPPRASGDTILNSATATVTKPVSVLGHGDVLKPKDVKRLTIRAS